MTLVDLDSYHLEVLVDAVVLVAVVVVDYFLIYYDDLLEIND